MRGIKFPNGRPDTSYTVQVNGDPVVIDDHELSTFLTEPDMEGVIISFEEVHGLILMLLAYYKREVSLIEQELAAHRSGMYLRLKTMPLSEIVGGERSLDAGKAVSDEVVKNRTSYDPRVRELQVSLVETRYLLDRVNGTLSILAGVWEGARALNANQRKAIMEAGTYAPERPQGLWKTAIFEK